MQVIMIGPIMLKYSLIMAIIAASTGYLVILFRTRHLDTRLRKAVLDDLMVALLIGILIWRLSPLVFNAKAMMHSPKSLLYYTGGTSGILLAALAAVLIIAYKCVKQHKPWTVYANTGLTWLISAYGIWDLLRIFLDDGGYPAVGTAIVAAAVVVYQFRHRERIFSSYLLVCTVMWSAIGLFAVSLVDESVEALWLGLGGMQLILLFMAIMALIMKGILEKKESQST